jgi:hypothetical protein
MCLAEYLRGNVAVLTVALIVVSLLHKDMDNFIHV